MLVVLTNGFRIEHIELPKIKISQLYIKLDKKLIVDIDRVDIDIKSGKDSSFEEIHSLATKLPYLYTLFKSISIQNINYDNKIVHFLYRDEIFYVDSDFLTVDARIKEAIGLIDIDIEQLILKDFQLKMRGSLKVKLREKKFDFKGDFETFNIQGGIELKINDNKLYYRLHSKKVDTIKPFMDFLSKKADLAPLVSAWIYKKIVADEYRLDNLEGKFDLNTMEFYPHLMRAKVEVKNAVVKFHKDAPSALLKSLDVLLIDNQLIFDIKKAEFQSQDISKSKIHIYNLMRGQAGIVLDLKGNIKLDNSIQAILHAYDIKVPLIQTAGLTKTNIMLDISFSEFEGVKSYSGSFEMRDANLTLSSLPIHSRSAYIELDNGMIYLKNVNLSYATLFDIDTSGELNLENEIYRSENHINSIFVGFEELEVLNIEDIDFSFVMKIEANGVLIDIDKLKTKLHFLSDKNIITVEKLKLISPYSQLMKDENIHDGTLKIETKDFESYKIKADLKDVDLPLSKDSKQLKKIDIDITTDGKNIELISADKKVKISKKEELKLFIKDLDVIIDSSKFSKTSSINRATIIGVNSSIIDINTTLKIPSESFIYKLNNSSSTFYSKLEKQSIYMQKADKTLLLTCRDLTDEFMNTALGKDAFENGVFELNIDQNNTDYLDGTFSAKNTTIRGLTFYNNLMALVHTIPSLVTFKNPGFNEDGYKIDSSIIYFRKHGDLLTFNKIVIDGKSADIIGKGSINLKTKKIDITLQISVLKNLSSMVNSIPVVNYIILGKDGRIYTEVNIKGTVKKPIIITNVVQDTALSPFSIIKRTIETPFRIFQ